MPSSISISHQVWKQKIVRKIFSIGLVFAILVSLAFPSPALAITPIQLTDIGYKDCPPEMAEGSVTSGGVTREAFCFLVTGKANNPSSKTVYDADVFGRIFDADNNPVLQNRGRLGSIEVVPPGTSDFAMRISIPANLTTPLQLKQFKASGFTGKIRQ